MKNEIQKHMLAYLGKGFSVIPIGINKKPTLSTWKEYQSRKPTEAEIGGWCANPATVGIGIVTGKISGLAVLDIDVGADTKGLSLPPTPSVKTGGGGWHHYYKYPSGNALQSINGFRHKMDFKAEGGYVIAPPSSHKSGKQYEWTTPLEDVELEEVPGWLVQEVAPKNAKNKDWKKIIAGTSKGERNDTAAAYIGKLLHGLSEDDWESIGWGSLVAWNGNNKPPLPEKELRDVFESIATAEKKQRGEDKDDGSYAGKLIKIILSTDALLFHDQHQDGYVSLNNSGAEILKLNSKQFKKWVAKMSWEQFGKPIRSEDTRTVIGTLEGIALYKMEQHTLHVRTAAHEGAFWYDLGKSAVRMTKAGWEVVDNPPILFRRYQDPQVTPVRGGSLSQLFEFVNIKNKQHQLLIQAWCVTGILPGFPHPFSTFHGPQGSAKSTTVRVFKQLLDPSQIQLSSPPDNFREFIQLGSHHWFLPIDNLSKLPEWLSDSLCRACTGEGFSKRELYSDDDDIVYSFQNVGSLNGINLVVEKPDLLERCIIFGLEKIERVENMASFTERFNQARPLILGAMFDAVVGAMQRVDAFPQDNGFRMSDFARWGCAIAEALGYTTGDFTNAYKSNISLQHQEAVDASPIAQAIELFMKKEQKSEWRGTPTELYRLLEGIAQTENIDTKSQTWPKAASWMWRRLTPVETNLRARGIKISRTSGEERIITITTESAVNAVGTVEAIACIAENTDSITNRTVEDAVGVSMQEMQDIQQHDSIDSIFENL